MKTLKNSFANIGVDNLIQHPNYFMVDKSTSNDYLEESIKKTGKEFMYPIVVVRVINPKIPNSYWVVSGINRLNTFKEMGLTEVMVMVRKVKDETEAEDFFNKMNNQRINTGRDIIMEVPNQ